MNGCGLVADAGGTNIRFALVDLGASAGPALLGPRKFSSRDFSGIAEAARAYLEGNDVKPVMAVVSVAGPVRDNAIHMTNLGWNFSGQSLGAALDIPKIGLINDYEAIAMGIPVLAEADLRDVGPKIPANRADRETVAVIGPGTGLGVGGYVRVKAQTIPLVAEGGHCDFAPWDEVEIEILRTLQRKFGHVSNERVLSGPGLVNLHEALSDIEGVAPEKLGPHDITARAAQDPGSHCGKVLARFCSILGSVAGNVALTLGARDGVMLAGGILPAVADFLMGSDFRKRFEAKGRFEDYMKAIPTRLIVNDNAGMLGAATLVRAMAGR